MDQDLQTQIVEGLAEVKPTHIKPKQQGKYMNFFLLGMIVVIAAAITGLGIYYFVNIRNRNSDTANIVTNTSVSAISSSETATSTSSSGETTSSTSASTNGDVFDFYDGRLKLNYKMPKQQSYTGANYSIFNIDCKELNDDCISLDVIEKKPAQWIVANTSYAATNYLNADSYGLVFNLTNGRFDRSRLGCDGTCGSLAVVTVTAYYKNTNLANAWEEIYTYHNKNVVNQQAAELSLAPNLLAKEQKWGLETYKIALPYPFAASQLEDIYLTKAGDYIYLVNINYDDAKNLEAINKVVNAFSL